jgi:hypothetical protein
LKNLLTDIPSKYAQRHRIYILGGISVLFLNFSIAQVKNEISPEQLIVRNAASVYFQSLGEQSGVYRGTEYTGYPFQIKVGASIF